MRIILYTTCIMFVLFSCDKGADGYYNDPNISLNIGALNKPPYKVGESINLALNIKFKDVIPDEEYSWEIMASEGEGTFSDHDGTFTQDKTLVKKTITYTPSSAGDHKLNVILRYYDNKDIVKKKTVSLKVEKSPFKVQAKVDKANIENNEYTISLNIVGENSDYLKTKKYKLKGVEVQGMTGELKVNDVSQELKYGYNALELSKVEFKIDNNSDGIEPKLILCVSDEKGETFVAECNFSEYKETLLEALRKKEADEKAKKEAEEVKKLSKVLQKQVNSIDKNNLEQNQKLLEDLEKAKETLEKGKEVSDDNELDNKLNFIEEQIDKLSDKIDIQQRFKERFGDITPEGALIDVIRGKVNNVKEEVELCIDAGADLEAKDDNGWTPLHMAAKGGYTEVVELLIKRGAEVNVKTKNGWTSLDIAAEKGHTEVVELLIEAGADVNVKNNDGDTPLHQAVYSGNPKIAELLIKAGADVNAKADPGWTPLHWAAKGGYTEVAKLLIKSGADVNAKNNYDYTPLHWAAGAGQTRVAELLIKAGADVNVKNEDGNTPLHRAADLGKTEVVELLIKGGAYVNEKNNDNLTPCDLALQNGHQEMRSILSLWRFL